MQQTTVTRQQILDALTSAFEPLPYTHALWQGGAAANGRVDEWSDIDLQLDVDDEFAEQAMQQVEAVLETLSPVDLKLELPMPTWHGHRQTFFRLADASEYLLIDFVVIQHSNPRKFLEPEIHGRAVVHFDKDGTTRVAPIDRDAFSAQLSARVATLRTQFELFQVMTRKEIQRRNPLEAFAYYQSMVIRPLIEVLGVLYRPFHANFHTRYVYTEFPPEVATRLERLVLVSSLADLEARLPEAEAWFYETLAEIDRIGVEALVATA
jgi:hypothetical protein